MSDYSIVPVPIDMLDLIWDRVAPLVEDVAKVSYGEVTLEDTYQSLKSGGSLLVLICDGKDIVAMNTVEIRKIEDGTKIIYILSVAGTKLHRWMDDFLVWTENLGKMNGCTEIRGIASRQGWTKKMKSLGWHTVKTILAKEI